MSLVNKPKPAPRSPIQCSKANPMCDGMYLRQECYGRPACAYSRFTWVDEDAPEAPEKCTDTAD